jgi:hypothetical protein
MIDKSTYIKFSEITDVIASVQLIATLAEHVKEEPLFWKWIVLAASSAIQGAMVCNVGGTSTLGALDENSREQMLAYLGSDDPDSMKPPKQWLATFDSLLKWAQDPARTPDGAIWTVSKEQREALKFLQHLRNEFTHFKVSGWAIELAEIPKAVRAALEGTEQLMLASPWVRRHAEDDELGLLKSSLAKARQVFG